MGATQAWVALSSLGSHKTLRLHRRRFPCSPSTSGKRTEEPLASDVLSIKIPRMPKISLFSKYERQKDRRTFGERRLIYQDPEDAKAKGLRVEKPIPLPVN